MRRDKNIGTPMLVNLPTEGYEDTGEGGMAFFLVVRCKPLEEERRQTCMAGDIWWLLQDSCLNPRTVLDMPQPIDGGLLIGSTGQSLYMESKEFYFTPTLKDLTPEGKRLYHTLKKLYGKVDIVTLLDT